MRPRQSSGASLLAGAALGGLLGGPPGALVGGLLSAAANSSEPPMPLEEALWQVLEENGLRPVAVNRETWSSVRLLFEFGPDCYDVIRASVPAKSYSSPEARDDALYDDAFARILAWRSRRGS